VLAKHAGDQQRQHRCSHDRVQRHVELADRAPRSSSATRAFIVLLSSRASSCRACGRPTSWKHARAAPEHPPGQHPLHHLPGGDAVPHDRHPRRRGPGCGGPEGARLDGAAGDGAARAGRDGLRRGGELRSPRYLAASWPISPCLPRG
jgi:hypothetical protein